MLRLSKKQFDEISNRHPRPTKRIQNNDQIDDAYKQALEVLHHLQSCGGSLLFGCNPFRFQVQVISPNASCDHTNIQKGCEDALNRIAWQDDKQNRYLSEPPNWG